MVDSRFVYRYRIVFSPTTSLSPLGMRPLALRILEPFPTTVEERYQNWLVDQIEAGRMFNDEQLEWLGMIKDHISSSVTIEMEDFDYAPFNQRGGGIQIYKLFGSDLEKILQELNQALVE